MLSRKNHVFAFLMVTSVYGFSQEPQRPAVALSQIDIPIRINLRPIYALAERNVDTVFASPGYPDGWQQADCATRYRYLFRRSPLQMSMKGTSLDLSFTGFYRIAGSTRICRGTTVLSPWTPACTCGYDEPERKVTIGFSTSFTLLPTYVLQTKITRKEPVAHDKCEVCFWGQDVTAEVLNGLKKELDGSKKAMEDSFGTVNLRPYLQPVWNLLNDVYTIPGAGYFSLNPKSFRMQNIGASNDLLNVTIGISASPVVTFEKTVAKSSPLPDLTMTAGPGGFAVNLDAALQYDSLSKIVNGYMAGKRFDLSEGLFAKHIVVKEVSLAGSQDNHLLIKVDFTGSFTGSAFFTGKPVYNEAEQALEVQDLDYDLQTKNLLLKTAKWLFSGKIETELRKASHISLRNYFDTAQKALNNYLNQEWAKGIKGSGTINKLTLVSAQAMPGYLLLRTACTGNLQINVSEIDLALKR